jgi:hypothetical protein
VGSEVIERLANFLTGRDWRRDGVLAKPWPVEDGTADAAEWMLSVVFSLGVLRTVEDVFVERGSMEIGDMGTKSGLPSLFATDSKFFIRSNGRRPFG